MKNNLEEKWAATARRLSLGKTESERLFAEITRRHGERHRHYHGLGHLVALFDVLEPVWPQIAERTRVELAVWFHDIIYKPLRSDNEEKSAELATNRLTKAGVDASLVERVERLIRTTSNHQAGGTDQDDALFLDADFSILGAPTDVYDWYVDAIRKEYRMVPGPMFRAGRTKFLRHALAQPRVFHTDYFESRFGNKARQNMARELDRME
jgi:predicted metal-dependent HD superfamily phosphohydrolase